MRQNIIVALDGMGSYDATMVALKIAKHPRLWGFKVNDLLLQKGVEIIRQLRRIGGLRDFGVFADAKLYDIPNTMTNGIKACAEAGASIISVHLPAMYNPPEEFASKLAGVTILTSSDPDDLPTFETFRRHMDSAVRNKYGHVVCSARHIDNWRPYIGDMKIICPGIRPKWASADDQKLTMPPQEAEQKGADYLVIGRPITKAEDPFEAMDCLFGDTAPTGEKLRKEIVSVYRCNDCSCLNIVVKGNHHPWCSCGSDDFDWTSEHQNITREKAEKIVEEDDR
jgi:orotidine-5'-phosphate decarboxylase